MNKLILASGSPRRKEFLSYLGIPFSVVIPHADESVIKDEIPSELVKRLSKLKASIVAKEYPDAAVIAADTVVSLNSEILGKPKNRDEAFLMSIMGVYWHNLEFFSVIFILLRNF